MAFDKEGPLTKGIAACIKNMTHNRLPENEIIHGDCIEIISDFPAGSVDLIFADPPYNLQLQQELWRPNLTKVQAVEDQWDQFDSFETYDRFTHAWLSACRRVLKDTGTLWVIGTYHNIFRIGKILQDLEYWVLNDFVWVKNNPMPNFRGVRFTNAQETLIWAQKAKGNSYTFNHHVMKAINGDLQMRSDWYLPICSGKERLKINGKKAHSTQKPEALLYRIILASSDPGDVILDPFFGTGTSGAVAKKLGRKWVGIELNEVYVAVAEERLASISGQEPPTQALNLRTKHRKMRIPFGTLMERGLIHPGDTLYFEGKDDITAMVLADGHLRCREDEGSIHKVAKEIVKAPCNGWDHWYYRDNDGTYLPIDNLREIVRSEWNDCSDKSN